MQPMTFQIGVKALIMHDNRVLVLKCIDRLGNFSWDVPGGRMGKGEEITQTLLREIQEEVPTIANSIVGDLVHVHKTSVDINGHGLLLLFYKVLADIPEVSLSDEHVEYRWVNKQELSELSFSESVRDAFRKALELVLQ